MSTKSKIIPTVADLYKVHGTYTNQILTVCKNGVIRIKREIKKKKKYY